jgi:GNAT superfamily N-acetyltransferase
MDASNLFDTLGPLGDDEWELPSTKLRLLQAQCAPVVLRRDLTKALVAFSSCNGDGATDSSSNHPEQANVAAASASTAALSPASPASSASASPSPPASSSLRIRRATPADYEAVGALTVAAYGQFVTGPTDPYIHHLRDARSRDEQAELWVATLPAAELVQPESAAALGADNDAEVVVGAVTICPPGSVWRELAGPGQGEFRMLVTDPSVQRRGVGAALVRFCLRHARTPEGGNCHSVAISTRTSMRTAHRLYEREGFVHAPERDWSPRPGVDLLAFVAHLDKDDTTTTTPPPRVVWTGAWGAGSFGKKPFDC